MPLSGYDSAKIACSMPVILTALTRELGRAHDAITIR